MTRILTAAAFVFGLAAGLVTEYRRRKREELSLSDVVELNRQADRDYDRRYEQPTHPPTSPASVPVGACDAQVAGGVTTYKDPERLSRLSRGYWTMGGRA